MDQLRTFTIIKFDSSRFSNFSDFIIAQSEQNDLLQSKIKEIFEDIANILVSRCEQYIYKSAKSAPPSMTISKFNRIKLMPKANLNHLIESAESAERILQASFNNEFKNLKDENTIEDSSILTISKVLPIDNVVNLNQEVEKYNVGVSYTIRSAIRMHCRRLLTLFKLIDFMIRDSLYDAVAASFYDFAMTMKTISQRNRGLINIGEKEVDNTGSEQMAIPLFNLNLSFEKQKETDNSDFNNKAVVETATEKSNPPDAAITIDNKNIQCISAIKFIPSQNSAIETFRRVLTDVCHIAIYSEGLFYHEKCLRLFEPVRDEITASHLEDRIYMDNEQNRIQEYLRNCTNCFAIDMQFCTDQIALFQLWIDRCNKASTLVASALEYRLQDIPPEKIAAQLDEWDDLLVRCERINLIERVGIFNVQLKDLKNVIKETISQGQTIYIRTIPELYITSGDSFNKEVSGFVDNVAKDYQTLDEFVQVVEAYNYCVKQQNGIIDRLKYINSLREILEERNVRLSEAILQQKVTITNIFQKFNSVLVEFDGIFESEVKLYKSEMIKRLNVLLLPIQEFQRYLSIINTRLLEGELKVINPVEVLGILETFRIDIDSIAAQLNVLDYYQNLFHVSYFEKGLEGHISEAVKGNVLLWQSIQKITELSETLMSTNFLDCSCDDIMQKVAMTKNELTSSPYFYEMKQEMLKNESSEQANEIRGLYNAYIFLLTNVEEIALVLPVIKQLQSKTLKPIHIELISDAIGCNIYENSDLTVKELIEDLNVMYHFKTIHSVFMESEVLYNLESKVHAIMRKLKDLEFKFESDPENISLVYVTNFPVIFERLEDSLLTILSIRMSKYILPIVETVDELKETLSKWLSLAKKFHDFQILFLNQRALFTSPRTALHLGKYLKNFKIVDDNWRSIVKVASYTLKLTQVLVHKQVTASLQLAQSNLLIIDEGFKAMVEVQCERYPRLRLMRPKLLRDMYISQDLKSIFLTSCKYIFPFIITDAEFDRDEAYNLLSVRSDHEKIVFSKPCSGRVNLAEWMFAAETFIHEKLQKDIKSLLADEGRSITDELRADRYCEQAQMLVYQVKLWSSIEKIVFGQDGGLNVHLQLRSLFLDINDQMNMISSLLKDSGSNKVSIMVANLISIMSYFRDLINHLTREYSHSLTINDQPALRSAIDPYQFNAFSLALRKNVDSFSGEITVIQNYLKEKYGCKYQGFNPRMIITPLTEKCFFSIMNAFKSRSIPVLSGSSSETTMKMLGYELGVEMMQYHVDSLSATGSNFAEQMQNIVNACLRSGIWFTFQGTESLSLKDIATVGNVLSAFVLQQRLGTNKVANDIMSDIDPMLQVRDSGRIFLINFHTICAFGVSNFDTVNLFRQIYVSTVKLRDILSVLLLAYNFVFVNKTSIQLEALVNYLVQCKLADYEVLSSIVIVCIRKVGLEIKHSLINASMQMSLLAKALFEKLPMTFHSKVDSSDLQLIGNMFLDIIYNPDTDRRQDLGIDKSADPLTLLLSHLHNNNFQSHKVILVLGNPSFGKTTIIKQALKKIMESAEVSGAIPKYHVYPQVLSPSILEASYNDDHSATSERIGEVNAFRIRALLKEYFENTNPMTSCFIQVDIASSWQGVHTIIPLFKIIKEKYFLHRAAMICEAIELQHYDPASLLDINLIAVNERSYTLDGMIEAEVVKYSSG